MAGTVAPNIVTDGLVLYLDAANTKSYPGSGTAINNLSTLPLTFQLVNGVTYSLDNNGVMQFDGVDDYITSNLVYTMTPNMTWNVWCKKTSTGNQFNMIFSNTIPYLAFRGEGSGASTNKFHSSWFTVANGINTQRNLFTTLAYSLNTWYNITFTLSFNIPNQLTIGKLYVNGMYDTQLSAPTDSLYQVNSTNRLRIGSYPPPQYPFPGYIGPLSIYDRILTDQEILQNYNATKTRFGLT
jgi:hypothetical protein